MSYCNKQIFEIVANNICLRAEKLGMTTSEAKSLIEKFPLKGVDFFNLTMATKDVYDWLENNCMDHRVKRSSHRLIDMFEEEEKKIYSERAVVSKYNCSSVYLWYYYSGYRDLTIDELKRAIKLQYDSQIIELAVKSLRKSALQQVIDEGANDMTLPVDLAKQELNKFK